MNSNTIATICGVISVVAAVVSVLSFISAKKSFKKIEKLNIQEETENAEFSLWKKKILAWYEVHREHVNDMVFSLKETYGYRPSDEDYNSPELWKANHWKWFFKTQY